MDNSLPPVVPSATERAAAPPPPPLPLLPPATGASHALPARPASSRVARGWRIAAIVFGVLLALSLLAHLSGWLSAFTPVSSAGAHFHETLVEDHDSHHKVAIIPVEGVIFSGGPEDLVKGVQDRLKRAEEDDHVEAVILKVDSPGGEVLASDDIAGAIQEFQKKTGKPVVASMGSLAASGGYYVSAPCQWIVAHELTITGSIGVIFHGYNYRGLMKKVGLAPQVYKSGKFKDMLSGEKDLDNLSPAEREVVQEERDMVQRMIGETFDRFKSVVAEGRTESARLNKDASDSKGKPLRSDWTNYADGRILSGREALDLGLVDELGNFKTAFERAKTLAGIDDAKLIEYQPVFDLSKALGFLGRSDATRVKVDLGFDTPKLRAGRLYFLSPTLGL